MTVSATFRLKCQREGAVGLFTSQLRKHFNRGNISAKGDQISQLHKLLCFVCFVV